MSVGINYDQRPLLDPSLLRFLPSEISQADLEDLILNHLNPILEQLELYELDLFDAAPQKSFNSYEPGFHPLEKILEKIIERCRLFRTISKFEEPLEFLLYTLRNETTKFMRQGELDLRKVLDRKNEVLYATAKVAAKALNEIDDAYRSSRVNRPPLTASFCVETELGEGVYERTPELARRLLKEILVSITQILYFDESTDTESD